MRFFVHVFFALTFLFGCSSTKHASDKEPQLVTLSKVEQLEFGKVSVTELKNLFGEPQQIVQLKDTFSQQDVWVYKDNKDTDFDRVGFLVDKKTRIVKTATWSFRPSETLSKKDSLLRHFKNANFTSKVAGQVAKDYYSHDQIFSDSEIGVSFYVDEVSQSVMSVSFEAVQQRRLANERK